MKIRIEQMPAEALTKMWSLEANGPLKSSGAAPILKAEPSKAFQWLMPLPISVQHWLA